MILAAGDEAVLSVSGLDPDRAASVPPGTRVR
jgi:hypothetical protein